MNHWNTEGARPCSADPKLFDAPPFSAGRPLDKTPDGKRVVRVSHTAAERLRKAERICASCPFSAVECPADKATRMSEGFRHGRLHVQIGFKFKAVEWEAA